MRSLLINRVLWMFKGDSGTAAIAQTLLVRLFVLVVNTATGIITARMLGPSGRGAQTAMGAWVLLLPSAMLLGIPSALLYNFKRHPEQRSEIFSAALVLTIGLGGFASLIGILLIPIWLRNYSTEVIHLAQWLMMFVPLVMLTEIVRATLEANEQFSVANQLRFVPPLSTLFLLCAMTITGWLTPFTANLAYFLPGIPTLAWMLMSMRRSLRIRLHRLKASSWRLLSYGIRSYGIDLLASLLAQLQQVLVIGLLTPASLGMYAVSLSLSTVLNVFQASTVTVLFPKTAARPVSEVIALIGRAARISAAMTLVASLGAMLLGPMLLELLYGKAYLGAVPLFRLLMVEVTVGGTTMVLAQAFMALDRPGLVAVLQGVGLSLNLPLMLLLVPQYGLIGAGFALLGSTTARLIFILACYPLVLKVHPPSLWLTKEDLRFLKQRLSENK